MTCLTAGLCYPVQRSSLWVVSVGVRAFENFILDGWVQASLAGDLFWATSSWRQHTLALGQAGGLAVPRTHLCCLVKAAVFSRQAAQHPRRLLELERTVLAFAAGAAAFAA